MQPNSPWKEVLGVVGLIVFVCAGVGIVIYPDRYINGWSRERYGLEASRWQMRLGGIIFTGGAIYILCAVLLDIFR